VAHISVSRPLIGPANHIDVHPQLELALLKNLTLTGNWELVFGAKTLVDGIYGPAVNSSNQQSPATLVT